MSRQLIRDLHQTLPAGASLLIIDSDGTLLTVRRNGVQPLDPAQDDDLLPFIDQGHFARYLIGNTATSDTNPTNATYKLGIVAAHRGFTPHAHGTEHFVFSTGYAACGLYDAERDAIVTVPLQPGMMLHIPAMMPHTFNNRADQPLVLLIANTGMGLDHEDYAITAAKAEARAQHAHAHYHDYEPAVDFAKLAAVLRRMEQTLPHLQAHHRLTWRERVALRLRWLASQLEHGASI
ncbi:cupin domain-containing protein [uncultured Chloroflexus sp.]|uniref:cupin domain-containing protein n=1 Tax=uncultured Chloroflexus sp. TaxID=214040 RepID=UPI0026341334|nr:cupin domain-containing protein [uncultured Chloroflexus sp.]